MHILRAAFSLAVLVTLVADNHGTPPGSPALGKEQQAADAKRATAIARHIKQLASENFAERDAADEALRTIGRPAVSALRDASKSKDAEVARRAQRLIEAIEGPLGEPLADYQRYGLPMPPADAKLVQFDSGGRSIVNGKLMPPTYFVGFLLRMGRGKSPHVLLVGMQQVRVASQETVDVVEPKAELVPGLDPHYWDQATFDSNAGLAVALQCQARGWDAFAGALWARYLQHESGHSHGGFYQPANLPGRAAVAYLAWVYSANEMVMPHTDRSITLKRMRAALAAEPTLNTEARRGLLKHLEAALVPSKAKPGSVERMVDDLVDACNTDREHPGPDARYARLAHLGFAAVPALIEHLDDERLTRSVKQGFNNFPTWPVYMQHLASDILQELAGDDLGKDWLRRQQGWGIDKAAAQAWWQKAQQQGEEAYMVAHVLPAGDKEDWPQQLMLDIITEKYAARLPELYRTVLDRRPRIYSWPIAEALAKTSLPANQRRELFLYAARHKDLEHRRQGLCHLRELDPEQYMTILLATLDSLPRTPTEPYWHCREAALGILVLDIDDARAWQMLTKVAKRSDVGLRMEFLNCMGRREADHLRARQLQFLTEFLDDAEAPDRSKNPAMFSGPHAGFAFNRLEVRDLAAMQIGYLLDMSDRPDISWTPKQWQRLREQVKQRLKK